MSDGIRAVSLSSHLVIQTGLEILRAYFPGASHVGGSCLLPSLDGLHCLVGVRGNVYLLLPSRNQECESHSV